MKVGDNVIFIGLEIEDEHLKNFTYGNEYHISDITALPDGDIYGTHNAILFDNFRYGVLSHNFKKYFVTTDEFREIQLSKILK